MVSDFFLFYPFFPSLIFIVFYSSKTFNSIFLGFSSTYILFSFFPQYSKYYPSFLMIERHIFKKCYCVIVLRNYLWSSFTQLPVFFFFLIQLLLFLVDNLFLAFFHRILHLILLLILFLLLTFLVLNIFIA